MLADDILVLPAAGEVLDQPSLFNSHGQAALLVNAGDSQHGLQVIVVQAAGDDGGEHIGQPVAGEERLEH